MNLSYWWDYIELIYESTRMLLSVDTDPHAVHIIRVYSDVLCTHRSGVRNRI